MNLSARVLGLAAAVALTAIPFAHGQDDALKKQINEMK